MVTKVFRVEGRVQGVGFRWSALDEANHLNLAGWVKNEDDGAVTGLVQGEETDVSVFSEWLGRGPRAAKVDRVILEDAPPSGLRIFTVR